MCHIEFMIGIIYDMIVLRIPTIKMTCWCNLFRRVTCCSHLPDFVADKIRPTCHCLVSATCQPTRKTAATSLETKLVGKCEERVTALILAVHQWKSTGKRTRGRRRNRRWLDCIEEDLRRAGVTKCGKTAGREWMTLNDIAPDRQQWRNLTAASIAEISWTMNSWPHPLSRQRKCAWRQQSTMKHKHRKN